MFICKRCLERGYTNFGIALSIGPCEVCRVVGPCVDISATELHPKEGVPTPSGRPVLPEQLQRQAERMKKRSK